RRTRWIGRGSASTPRGACSVRMSRPASVVTKAAASRPTGMIGPVLCLDRHATLLSALLLSGCPSNPSEPEDEADPEPEPARLVEWDRWQRVTDPSVDAFADLRPADAVCDDAGWYPEPIAQTLEVQTELCDYVTLWQPSLAPIEPGDVVTVY